ncbi:Molybdenum cofactor synthesis protein 3 [Chamberlinius hualienensis]
MILTKEEINRYSRQLLLPEIGVHGQEKLKSTSVLIVGAGGLGCPVAIYLAAAGIGKLGVIDYDNIEINNLHRQILHTEEKVGTSKAQSVVDSIKKLNSSVECVAVNEQLTNVNGLSIIEKYSLFHLNLLFKYLLNDACVICHKPLVSGSALRFEGQLTIYHFNGAPCYRCLYPVPPPPELVTNCSDGGVVGPVPGLIGTMQALEVIKLAAGLPVSYAGKMLMFDGLTGSYRCVKLRAKQQNCVVCGINPSITELQNYEEFCGAPACDRVQKLSILSEHERIDCKTYQNMCNEHIPHLLVDVREAVAFDICKLPNSYNLPISKIDNPDRVSQLKSQIGSINHQKLDSFQVIVVCRRGNDSQLAVKSLKETMKDMNITIQDVKGGLYSWAAEVDSAFPVY